LNAHVRGETIAEDMPMTGSSARLGPRRRAAPREHAAVLSCHLERPLDDEVWRRFDSFQRRRPGGFDVVALIRPPDPDHGESEERWLERAATVAGRAPLGLHTHWTSPTHARPTGGDPVDRVRSQVAWMRQRALDPVFFCGGGWYSDERVRAALVELGLVDCTPRVGVPGPGVMPTTHSIGRLARALFAPLPGYVHVYFHDYDLLDSRRRVTLILALAALGRLRTPRDARSLVGAELRLDAMPQRPEGLGSVT
jgi:hypothetical protein